MNTPRQLAFRLAPDPSLARADFIPADSNRMALAWIDRAATWPAGRLVLSGPTGSGKTHLAAIFAHDRGAPVVPAEALASESPPALLPAHGSLVVESADQAPEAPLLHLLNMAAEAGGKVLLTARLPSTAWPTGLADLRSRLAASGQAALGIPDQGLVRQVLEKAAADRQMALPATLLDWLAARLPRDLSLAAAFVARLDEAALAAGRAPDLRLARTLAAPDFWEAPMKSP